MTEARRAVRRLYLTDHPLLKEMLARKMQLRFRMNSPYYENRTGRDEILQLIYIPRNQIEDGVFQQTDIYRELQRCKNDPLVVIYNGFEYSKEGDTFFCLLEELAGLEEKKSVRIRTDVLNIHSPRPAEEPATDISEEDVARLKLRQWAKRRINEALQNAFDEKKFDLQADYELFPLYRQIWKLQNGLSCVMKYTASDNGPYDFFRFAEDVSEKTELDLCLAEEVLEELFKEGIITWPYVAGRDILIAEPELAEDARCSCRSNQIVLDLLQEKKAPELQPAELKSGTAMLLRFMKLHGAGSPDELLQQFRHLNQVSMHGIIFREEKQYRISETDYRKIKTLPEKLLDFSVIYEANHLLDAFSEGRLNQRDFRMETEQMAARLYEKILANSV